MSIQIIVIILYFAISVFVGIAMSRGTNTSSKFHGTQLGVAAIVCASAGEWLGGTATTGVSEYGFLYGLSGAEPICRHSPVCVRRRDILLHR